MPPGLGMPSRRLVSQEDHSLIQRPDVPRSRFVGSWTRKTAFDAGRLVPFLVDEVLPGDHMKYSVTAYLRMSTPLFPLFDNQRVDTFFFFVPNRILWDNWVKFMGEQKTLTDNPANYSVPLIAGNAGGFAVGSLYDHMGLPTAGQITAGNTLAINALPIRAYKLIWLEWFRDENLQDLGELYTGDAPENETVYSLYRRGKAHDYFTSCLPWPQKFTAPTVPLNGTAPVRGIAVGATNPIINAGAVWETGGVAAAYTSAFAAYSQPGGQTAAAYIQATPGPLSYPVIYADLAAATGVTINTLRQAWLVQSLLERDARGGTRYTELVKSHFGVNSPDARLQRPEYIGGGSSPLTLTPIAQTAPSEATPLGALGAAGTSVGQHTASFAATEHGYILGLINVRSELSYQQGMHRMWSRRTRYDFYWPSLAGLGEQAVLVKELYATGVQATDDAVFGYQERWHEYRTRTSEVTGVMRSTATGTLDAWHLAERFLTPPTLGSAFIVDSTPMARVLAAGTQANNQQYLADILINREAVRPIPIYGTPAALGRF